MEAKGRKYPRKASLSIVLELKMRFETDGFSNKESGNLVTGNLGESSVK